MSLRKVLRSAAAVGAAVVALVGQAPVGAAVVIASFDPLVGPVMPGISYLGEANFFIADGCLSIQGIVNNGDTCSDGTMFMNSAQVIFSDGSGDLDTITFGPGGIDINAVDIDDGEIVGLSTDFASPTVFLNTSYFIGEVALGFIFGNANAAGGAVLQLSQDNNEPPVLSNVATNITFNRVPEPATLALVGLAAFGVAAASRRRKAQA